MKLSEIKKILTNLQELHFVLENGQQVPDHFHVTEIGQINKRFIDCGGVIRDEKAINFQLWEQVYQCIDTAFDLQKLIQYNHFFRFKYTIAALKSTPFIAEYITGLLWYCF